MSTSRRSPAELLQNAQECERMAERALFDHDRKSFLDMAAHYRRMAAELAAGDGGAAE